MLRAVEQQPCVVGEIGDFIVPGGICACIREKDVKSKIRRVLISNRKVHVEILVEDTKH